MASHSPQPMLQQPAMPAVVGPQMHGCISAKSPCVSAASVSERDFTHGRPSQQQPVGWVPAQPREAGEAHPAVADLLPDELQARESDTAQAPLRLR
jgi:hypothetical protein